MSVREQLRRGETVAIDGLGRLRVHEGRILCKASQDLKLRVETEDVSPLAFGDLGLLAIDHRPEVHATNPRTGAPIVVAAKRLPAFYPARSLLVDLPAARPDAAIAAWDRPLPFDDLEAIGVRPFESHRADDHEWVEDVSSRVRPRRVLMLPEGLDRVLAVFDDRIAWLYDDTRAQHPVTIDRFLRAASVARVLSDLPRLTIDDAARVLAPVLATPADWFVLSALLGPAVPL